MLKWQPIGPLLEGASGMDWAPEIFVYKGQYYLTFTRNTRMYIAKSVSGRARGPYRQFTGSLIDRWAIDSHVYVHTDGTPYLYWNEGDGVKVGVLSADLKSVIREKHAFGVHTHPEKWITEIVQEAPFVVSYKAKLYIFFSGNSTGPNYGLGVCVATHPYNGPFVKLKSNPLIQERGSGHCSVVKDSKGLVIAFHMHTGGDRSTYLGRLTFDSQNNPRIVKFS